MTQAGQTRTLDRIAEEYLAVRPQYEAFTASLNTLIHNMLNTKNIEFFAIEPRTKTHESLVGKIHREDKAGKYKKLTEITDLAGIRIIAYLQEDCDKICGILKDNFDVDENNSVVKEDELDPDKFGYLSTHYVVSLKANRSGLVEYKPFADLKVEIQIRTILQHSWASIDWKFRYKEEKEAPKDLRRRLFRISALLEAADNEFSSVKIEIDKLRKTYSNNITRGDLNISVNSESIRSYLAESKVAKDIRSTAYECGIGQSKATKTGKLNTIFLTGTIEQLGMKTLSEVDLALREVEPTSREFFSYIAKIVSEEGFTTTLNYGAIVRYSLLRRASISEIKRVNSVFSLAPGFEKALLQFLELEKGKRK